MDAESSVATQLCARGSIVVCSIDPPFEESASPFMDEGDGLTRERECVRMLLSLVAHAVGCKMIIGAHNIIECQMHVEGRVIFFRYGRCRYLLYC